jgi:digeranylgeranylglycerophospholipid reductase
LAKTSSRDLDVLVIGGGASGLWAAITAARMGARTVLLERCSRIGERIACAEGIGAEGLSRLVTVRPEWVAASIDGACLFAPDGSQVRVSEPGAGYVLDKERFLRGLAEMAAGEGVDVMVGTEAGQVRELAGGELEVAAASGPAACRTSYRTGAVVGADGLESRAGRQVGIQGGVDPADLLLCAQYTVASIDVDPHVAEFHFGNDVAPGGYAWVFPRGDSTANIGVGVTRSSAAIKGRKPWVSPVERLVRFRQLRAPRSRELRHVVGGIPVARAPFKACAGGVFLAGDAARVADPLTGGGIVPGMASGEVSGLFAARWAKGGEKWDQLARGFSKAMIAQFKDRKLRVAARTALHAMSDHELTRMIQLMGDYASSGGLLRADPLALVKFMARSMPATFRVVRHLVGR